MLRALSAKNPNLLSALWCNRITSDVKQLKQAILYLKKALFQLHDQIPPVPFSQTKTAEMSCQKYLKCSMQLACTAPCHPNILYKTQQRAPELLCSLPDSLNNCLANHTSPVQVYRPYPGMPALSSHVSLIQACRPYPAMLLCWPYPVMPALSSHASLIQACLPCPLPSYGS